MNSSIHMYFPEIKQEAIRLRKEGYSYNYIIQYVPVSKSTLSDWLHGVAFTPNKHTLEVIGKARAASGLYKHGAKVKSLDKAEMQAKKDIQSLSKRDVMMLGLGIYIGEGGKTDGLTRIINSNAKIIKFTLKWLQVSFGVKIKNIKVRLFIYPDNNEKECIEYWSKNTGIPKNQFFKSTIDIRNNKNLSNHGKLPFGTAHVSIKSFGNKDHGVYLHRLIMAWINRVLC